MLMRFKFAAVCICLVTSVPGSGINDFELYKGNFGLGADYGKQMEYQVSLDFDFGFWSNRRSQFYLSVYHPIGFLIRNEQDKYRISANALPLLPLGFIDVAACFGGGESYPYLITVYMVAEGIPNSDLRLNMKLSDSSDVGLYAGHRLQVFPYSSQSKVDAYVQGGSFFQFKSMEIQLYYKREYIAPKQNLIGLNIMKSFRD